MASILPPGMAQRYYLARLLDQIPRSQILSARLRERGRVGIGKPGTVTVVFRINAPDAFRSAQGIWQGALIAGVLRDMSAQRHWRPIGGREYWLVLPGGREKYDSASAVEAPTEAAPEGTSAEEARRLIQSAASAAGIRLSRLDVWSLERGIAVEVTAATDRPDRASMLFSRLFKTVRGTERTPPKIEAAFLVVEDVRGRKVAAFGGTTRISASVSVTRR